MKKIVFVILFFLLIMPTVLAENLKGQVKSNIGIIIREQPTSNSNSISDGLANGREVTIVETVMSTDAHDGCGSKKWYKIEYSDSKTGYGYACSNFILLIDDKEDDEPIEVETNFEEALKKFPVSYHEKLKALHKLYPKAVFVPLEATWQNGSLMTFDEAVAGEIAEGKTLLWDSNGSYDGWKLFSSYNYSTDWFKNTYSGGGPNWYAVNEDILKYYLDPRNFLTEKSVFMFEALGYYPSLHNVDGVNSILKGSFMYDTYVDDSKTVKFADAIMDGAEESKVSPYFLASRIVQETGMTRSDLVLGTYPPSDSKKDIEKYGKYKEYSGYYNFFNINASGNDIIGNGLSYAKSKGWDSEYKAIVGGSKFIGGSYISVGQDTLYLQKWDVSCKGFNGCMAHQYQQNMQAPYSEGVSTYNAYLKNLGALMYNEAFIFTIPIYKDMPSSPASMPSPASPINYLSSLVVDGKSVANFDYNTSTYTIKVPYGTTNVHVEAKAKRSNAKVSGTGNIAIKNDKQKINIKVTAANGSVRIYTINIERDTDPGDITLDDILKKVNNYFKDKYLTGLTSHKDVVDKINALGYNVEVTITNLDGKLVTSGSLGTGYKVKLKYGNESKTFESVIYGDNNGDGEIELLDLLRVQKHLLNSIKLTGYNLKASDIDRNGSVDVKDLLLIKKHLLGDNAIKQ